MLSLLAREFFERSPLLVLPIGALFLFLAIFTVSTVRALRARKSDVARMAALPLQD